MFRKKKNSDEYEIDRELTGKLAIEGNAELQEKYDELKQKYNRLEKEHKSLQVEHSRLLFDMDAVIEHEVDVKCKMLTAKFQKEIRMLKEWATLYREDNKKLREENEQLRNKRVFSSEEYDLIILTSTTPQWELRKK